MLSSCTLLLVLAAGQEIEKQRKQYLYAYDGEIHSAMTFDYHPDTLKLVLRTKNMFYSLPFAEYKTHGLDIIMNRSDFINYFPYIDPGFNLTYKTKKKDAVLLQHHPQKPHVFTEVLGSHPPLRASFPEAVPPERIIEGCYSNDDIGFRVHVTMYSDGQFDARMLSYLRTGPRTVEVFKVSFCNATLASDKTIVADGWSKDKFPYMYAPWTITHREDWKEPYMILSLGNGEQYHLAKKEVCNHVPTCPV